MNKILIIMITTVMTVLLTLFVLWKLDVIYVNVSAPVEKSKEILGKDELSSLLKLEYPQLGEDIQAAYSLYGEPKFESDGQKDFWLLEEEGKELYISYDTEERIESFDLYVEGDKEEIRSLGERFLPVGSSFIDENHEEEERKNNTFRYTSTVYADSYYYNLPEEQGYATIVISNRESDLFSEEEEDDSPSYNLEVSVTTEWDDVNEWNQGPLNDSSEDVQEDNDAYAEESSEFMEEEIGVSSNEIDPTTVPEFDPSAILLNNDKVKHADFLPNAIQGIIAGINVSLQAPIGPIIESQIGQPDWRLESEGGYILMYKDYQAGLGVSYDYEDYPESPINSYYLPIDLTEEEIIQSLGEPTSQEYSEVGSGYYLYYQFEEYTLFFEKSSDDSTERYYSATLKGSY